MKRRLWSGLLVLYAAGVFALSQLPLAGGEAPFPHFDKCMHAAEFAILLALAWKALTPRRLAPLLLTAIYAGTDELHQLFVPSRTASSLDLASDLAGAVLALLALEVARRLWLLRRRRILSQVQSEVES